MAKAAKIKYNKSGIVCTGNLQVVGTATYGSWSPTNIAASGTLSVAGATTLNGAVTLGDAAGDDITVTGSIASGLTFKTGSARSITGPASNNLTITAPASRALVLQSNAADALTCNTDATVTIASGLTITAGGLTVTDGGLSVVAGATTFAATVSKTSANGAALNIKVAEGSHTVVGGGATETINNALPAGSLVLAVTTRVTTAFVFGGGGNVFDIGIAGATDRYGASVAKDLNTTTTLADAKAATGPFYYPAATNVVLTADAGTFTSGVLRYKIFYVDVTAPTS